MNSCFRRHVFVWFGCAILTGCLVATENSLPVSVTFLDVGQGLATLVGPDDLGDVVLLDTGPDSAGIADTLARRNVRRLRWVLVSHWHRDHVGGLYEILQTCTKEPTISVDTIWVAPDKELGWFGGEVLTLAQQCRIPVIEIHRGHRLQMPGHGTARVLWPPEYGERQGNEASLVVKWEFQQQSILWMADAGSFEELSILQLEPSLHGTILQAGHHGSNGSSHLDFLAQVQPTWIVVSAGASNEYGHPNVDALARMQLVAGAPSIRRTDLHGSVNWWWWPNVGLVPAWP